METFTYAVILASKNKGMVTFEVTRKIEDIQKEASQYRINDLATLIARWDLMGRGMKKYRYFLISKNQRIF